MQYYNCNPTKDYLERVSMTLKSGTSMYGLMLAAKSLGFDSYGKNGKISEINHSSLPLIAHITLNKSKKLYHYVIITNISDRKLTIKDPSMGTKTMTIDEFEKISTGNYLFIKKTVRVRKFTKRKSIKEEWYKLLKNNKSSIIYIFIFTIISTILEFLNLFSLKVILNNAILVKSIYNLVILLITFSFLLFFKTTISYLIQLSLLKMEELFSYYLKIKLTRHLLSLPNLYYQTKEKGIIISLFNDISTFSNSLLSSIIMFFSNSLILMFLYMFFLRLSYLLAITIIIGSATLFLFIYYQKRISRVLISKYYYIKDKYNSKLQQVIVSNDKIKGLHLEELMFQKIRKVTNCLEEKNYNIVKYSEIIKQVLNLLEGGVYLLILGLSGFVLITEQSMTLSTFLLLEGFIYMTLKSVENLVIIILKYQNIKKIKERLEEIFNHEKEILLPFQNYNYYTKDISIIISNLSFKYNDKIILNNINIKINPKDKIFIYGNSGSGKSTLVKLIGRFLPINFGQIKIGNIDVTHYNLADLRNIITYVTSNEMLMNANIKENIYLSRKPRINQNLLLKITGINKMFKEKKYNLDTILDENGANISRGEKSRINLAQAIFKPSEIYIFDECLNDVDIKLEKEILENILNYYNDKIVIYISHRLTNKNLFNRIFYLEKGKCHEQI